MNKRQQSVLVIDDNRDNVIVLKALINDMFPEIKVLMALSGKKGFEIALAKDPDIIFLDIIMPDMDGFEVCRKLKSHPDLVDIPVVFVTAARGDKENRMLALECGAEGFLSKPIDDYELITQIKAMEKIKIANVQKRNEKKRLDMLVKEQTNKLKIAHVQTLELLKSLEKENEARKKSEQALVEAHKLAHLGSYEFDLKSSELSCSDEALNILGVTLKEQVRTIAQLTKLVHPQDVTYLLENINQLDKENSTRDFIFRIIRPDNEERTINVRMMPKFDEATNRIGNFGTVQDITRIRKTEEAIRYLSYHDHLTGLFNRRFYEKVLVKLDKKENYPLTLVMADVNGLKMINDSFGHAVGDELLQKASNVIKKGCRENDIIARLGGDEFVIILIKTDVEAAAHFIKRLETMAAQEKIHGLKLSIAFGSRTKIRAEEDIQRVLKNAEDEMYRHKLYESASMRSKTIELIMNTLYEKSNREMRHSNRVSQICEKIGQKMDLQKNEINQIRTAGLIHDIGKMGIDEQILNKPGSLSDEEWKEIQRHPEIGYRILSSVNEFSEMATCILEHHERWDGRGYPKGLKGEEISIQGRIVAVADSFDAMTSDRTYRKGLAQEEAIAEINRCSGTHFDPQIAKMLVDVVHSERIH
ncbi:HD domain-containing protein [Acetobacterium woodii]|uniref:Stage 0 sporulation protein A homolog n=1 Tax=Acetobacterium woodii (strain ATCC 29683 / DSM 1030 / JCM 2381 / KCTC 1655 / WB1) TaxID=931626 RepID=H6LJ19_ACEWD|nr:HD domain-containing protein [Acetobacterium woodii]AFA47382.1 diguanylate cyclase and metal dependent phosphohydrolase [Acetobacterium woodii DSM 1030]